MELELALSRDLVSLGRLATTYIGHLNFSDFISRVRVYVLSECFMHFAYDVFVKTHVVDIIYLLSK